MKNKIIKILTVFLLFFVIFYKVDANIVEAPLLNKVIYVDPGHGGIGLIQNKL